jgi:hypothetical protein
MRGTALRRPRLDRIDGRGLGPHLVPLPIGRRGDVAPATFRGGKLSGKLKTAGPNVKRPCNRPPTSESDATSGAPSERRTGASSGCEGRTSRSSPRTPPPPTHASSRTDRRVRYRRWRLQARWLTVSRNRALTTGRLGRRLVPERRWRALRQDVGRHPALRLESQGNGGSNPPAPMTPVKGLTLRVRPLAGDAPHTRG